MNMIEINDALCTNCNTCVEVCPLGIMKETDTIPFMPVENRQKCIFCGHCESACPESALKHFYPETVSEPLHTGQWVISAEQLGLYMRSRRSIRNYLDKSVDKKIIEEIVDIVRYAPTGVNRQSVNWTIVLNPVKVKELTVIAIDWMREMAKTESPLKAVIPFDMLITDHDNGEDNLCRNAPHLFIAHTLKSYSIGQTDATIALAHLDLTLPSFGLGGCWAGYLNLALRFSPEVFKAAGLPDGNVAHGIMLAGYPKFEYHRIPKRNSPIINWL
jgi:nitroreductase/NAD-dependent dihydropyrimidine dehydrogenase PreA subunit